MVKGFLPVPDSNFLVHWVLVACSGCTCSFDRLRYIFTFVIHAAALEVEAVEPVVVVVVVVVLYRFLL